uniref:DUF4773 domain-containing protein n=1 Tax=Panagrellus redivivus TaxID=6233 RepID=A0A7E5A1G7_PANRE
MDVTEPPKESTPEANSSTVSHHSAPPVMVSTMASVPFSSRSEKSIMDASIVVAVFQSWMNASIWLSKDFTFEIRDQVHAPKIVSVNGKRKQVLSFVLYDRTQKNFECSVWDKRVNGVYILLTSLELPSCVYISHAKCHSPSKRHVPKTVIKDLQLTIDSHAVVDLSTLPPPSAATSITKRKCIECDCPKKCDKSCRVLRPSDPWTFARLASKLSVDGEIKSFRNMHIRICGLPKVKGGSLECNVSDGSFLARFEGHYPNFEIGNGTVLELDVFDALFCASIDFSNKSFGCDHILVKGCFFLPEFVLTSSCVDVGEGSVMDNLRIPLTVAVTPVAGVSEGVAMIVTPESSVITLISQFDSHRNYEMWLESVPGILRKSRCPQKRVKLVITKHAQIG